MLNTAFQHVIDNDQYAYLADSLLKGRLSLDLPVPDALANLVNPYDFAARYDIAVNEGATIYWDYAFYQGQYYCYFGVVPAVLFYVPFQLITGSSLSTPTAIAFLGTVYLFVSALLIIRIAYRYFAQHMTPIRLLLGYLIFVGASNVFYLGFVSRFYSVPILTSMILTTLGLFLWLSARRESGRLVWLSILCLASGTILMVLNFGSRPQFVLACFLAFPIFWTEIFKERLLFSRKGFAATLSVLISIGVALAPLLAYNYCRFGSPLDFGSSYNLTGFDMTTYDQAKRTTLSIVFYYLFQPLNLSAEFPYVHITAMDFSTEWAPNEPMFGGLLFLTPCLFLILLLPFAYKLLKKKGIASLCIWMLIFSFIVLLVDTRQAGVTQRYFSDFAWYLALVDIVVVWTILERLSCTSRVAIPSLAISNGNVAACRIILLMVVVGVVLSAIVGGLSLISPERYDSVAAMNPVFYDQLVSLLACG